jgi:glycosyltransferase involved in cell wall biosynthesis
MTLKINFVSHGSHHLASHRMRVVKPAELLNVCSDGKINCTVDNKVDENANINIFNKHFDPEYNLKMMKENKYLSGIDICDDHFDREHGPYYKLACSYADFITCNTEKMADRIKEVTGKNAYVIPDPVTFNWAQPNILDRVVSDDPNPKFLWYGHGTNIKPLIPWAEALETTVTTITNTAVNHPNIDAIVWKPNLVEAIIDNFDIVLVPTTETPWAACKSPNRVTDALAAGKLVITDSEEIYSEFKDYIMIVDGIDSLKEVVKIWKNDPMMVSKMIEKGQEYVHRNYGYDKIVDTWLGMLTDMDFVRSYDYVAAG